ncbi:hypothetical protein AAG570_009228 [Ranatra chinensis]|uniref:Uncharacterized protein n=1 Tax=Ranatra chinensis TaxID=642074 RepID=A0ABD0ZA75_9HEMI
MTGEEAWARALLAYNSSLHSATGYTLLELMRAWQREDSPVSIEYVCGELVDQDDRKKGNRVDRLNTKATDRWDLVQAGDYVFIKKLVQTTEDGSPVCRVLYSGHKTVEVPTESEVRRNGAWTGYSRE